MFLLIIIFCQKTDTAFAIQNNCRDACTSAIAYYYVKMRLSGSCVVIIEYVAALGAELGRIGRIRRSPATLIALIYLSACGLGCTAVLAEFALIYCTA